MGAGTFVRRCRKKIRLLLDKDRCLPGHSYVLFVLTLYFVWFIQLSSLRICSASGSESISCVDHGRFGNVLVASSLKILNVLNLIAGFEMGRSFFICF